MAIRVKAVKDGFYKRLIKAGTVFVIDEKDKVLVNGGTVIKNGKKVQVKKAIWFVEESKLKQLEREERGDDLTEGANDDDDNPNLGEGEGENSSSGFSPLT